MEDTDTIVAPGYRMSKHGLSNGQYSLSCAPRTHLIRIIRDADSQEVDAVSAYDFEGIKRVMQKYLIDWRHITFFIPSQTLNAIMRQGLSGEFRQVDLEVHRLRMTAKQNSK